MWTVKKQGHCTEVSATLQMLWRWGPLFGLVLSCGNVVSHGNHHGLVTGVGLPQEGDITWGEVPWEIHGKTLKVSCEQPTF
jgi:hypothetical protein